MNAARKFAWRGAGLVLGTLALALCSAGTARAQDFEPLPVHPWSVKLGLFIPTNGSLKDQVADTWWYAGVDYKPNLRYRPLSGDVHLGVDFAFRDQGSKSVFSIPLLAKILWPITPTESRIRAYGGLGAGLYFINTRFIGGTTQPGLQFVAGVDLTERLFAEVAYDWVGGFTDDLGAGIRVDGVKLAGGVRF